MYYDDEDCEKEKDELMARLMTFILSMTLVLAGIGTVTLFQSCRSTHVMYVANSPKDAGYATGMALYLVYERAAKDKSDEFKDTVAAIWKAIDAIDTNDTEAIVSAAETILEAENKADVLENLTPAEKAALASVAKMLIQRLDAYVGANLNSEDTKEFILGVKDGVNTMIAITGEKTNDD